MGTSSAECGLLPLGKGIFLSKPKIDPSKFYYSKSESEAQAPSVILIFGWLGAKLPHLLKYVQAYDGMYPAAAKIIIRTEPSFFWSTQSTKNAYLVPAIDALELLGCLPPATNNRSEFIRRANIQPVIAQPVPGVLVHTFSNGGSWQLVTFGELLAARGGSYSKAVTSPCAVVLDSCPGACHIDGALRAFSGVVHNPVLRKIIRLIIQILYMYLALQRRFNSHQPSILDSMKRRMNNEHLLPWFGRNTHRLYIYSSQDNIVPSEEIEGHAKQAIEWGMQVRMERFEDSAHVAHARRYPLRYWGSIRKLWDDVSVKA